MVSARANLDNTCMCVIMSVRRGPSVVSLQCFIFFFMREEYQVAPQWKLVGSNLGAENCEDMQEMRRPWVKGAVLTKHMHGMTRVVLSALEQRMQTLGSESASSDSGDKQFPLGLACWCGSAAFGEGNAHPHSARLFLHSVWSTICLKQGKQKVLPLSDAQSSLPTFSRVS